MFTEYQLGLLYGNGYFNKNSFRFSSSNMELYQYVIKVIQLLKVDMNYSVIKNSDENELGVININDNNVVLVFKEIGFENMEAKKRLRLNPHFLRGYLETKGSFFQYKDKGSILWKCNFGGNSEDLEVIRDHFNSQGIKCRNIEFRMEKHINRAESTSFRFSIGARSSLEKLMEYLFPHDSIEVSQGLCEKVSTFISFNLNAPKNMVNIPDKVYSKPRYAVEAMCKLLKYELQKQTTTLPYEIYIGDNNNEWLFDGWKEAYNFVAKQFETTFDKSAPSFKGKDE